VSRGSLIRLGVLALLWGSSFLWIKIALRGLSPVQITLVRLALGAAVLLVIVRARRLRLPRDGRIWAHFTIAAFMANALPYWLFGVGERTVPSNLAGALNATTPLWTLAIAVAVGTERRPSVLRILGLVIGFLGALLILAPWNADLAGSLAGAAACLAAALSYGVSFVYMARHLTGRGIPPLVLSACQLATATAILAVATPIAGRQPVHLAADVVASIAVLGLLGTGIAYVLNYRLITDDGPTAASAVTYLLPVVAVILGAAVLSEPLTWQLLAGTALVLTGIALVQRRRARRASLPS
jgi:drug/metabolite transporter (DMT)-like permease